jgi:hypothetical protein
LGTSAFTAGWGSAFLSGRHETRVFNFFAIRASRTGSKFRLLYRRP